MSIQTLVFVNETCEGTRLGRRRACGVCNIQKKKCVPIPESPLLCENCKKKNLKACPPPSNQKGKLAIYLASVAQQGNVDEIVPTRLPVVGTVTSSRRPDDVDHPNVGHSNEYSTSYTFSGHQTAYRPIADATENAVRPIQGDSISHVALLPDISYSQDFTEPVYNVQLRNTAERSLRYHSGHFQQQNNPSNGSSGKDRSVPQVPISDKTDFARADSVAGGAYTQGTYSHNAPLTSSGDDLAQVLHRLYQMDHEAHMSPELSKAALPSECYLTSAEDVSFGPYYTTNSAYGCAGFCGSHHALWLPSESTYPSYSLGSIGDDYGGTYQRDSLVTGMPAAEDNYEEVVQMFRNIQWFPD